MRLTGPLIALETAAQIAVFPFQGHDLQGASHQLAHLIDSVGLGDVVKSALLHGGHGGVQRGVAGDDDNLAVGLGGAGLAQHGQPIDILHAQVGEDQIKILAPQRLDGLLATQAGGDRVALLLEEMREGFEGGGLVINDEEPGLMDLIHWYLHRPARERSRRRPPGGWTPRWPPPVRG